MTALALFWIAATVALWQSAPWWAVLSFALGIVLALWVAE
jgi:hypothetical protein